MILKVLIDDQAFDLNVSEAMLAEGEDFFAKLDRDMDRGWQMSRDWVEKPDQLQRCQIVADRLLTALEAEKKPVAGLMAAYIISRMPQIESVRIDTSGDMSETEFNV